jgi:hypothetical protein
LLEGISPWIGINKKTHKKVFCELVCERHFYKNVPGLGGRVAARGPVSTKEGARRKLSHRGTDSVT